MGHSALRTYVMGERAFTETANDDDLTRMCALVQDALRAGAIGFSTSRTHNHITADERPVASRVADWHEVRAIVNAMGELNAGIFEIAGETTGRDPRARARVFRSLEESRGRVACADHVRHVLGARCARSVAAVLRSGRRDRRGRRPHGDPGALARVERVVVVRRQHAVRQVGRVERHPLRCRSRSRRRSCAIRRSNARSSTSRRRRTKDRASSAPRRDRRIGTGSI